MSDIDPIHRIAYEHGADPIEHAVMHLGFHIEARDAVLTGEVKHGHAITLLAQDEESHARRLIGQLLNAGWTPPDVTALRARRDRGTS